MDEMSNKTYAMAALAIGGLAVVASLLAQNALVALLAALMVLLSAVLWKTGHILLPMLTGHFNTVEVRDPYEIPPQRDMVIKRCGSRYYASMFMQARITSSVTEMDLASKSLFMEYFERAVGSVRSVVKFSVVVAGVDMSEFGDKLKSRRGEIETDRARLAASGKVSEQAELTRLDREVSMINKQLERMASGEKPMEVLAYVMTTAVGLSREDASRKVRNQAAEVKTGVANALNVDIQSLADEDMLRCLEWEYMLPTTLAELTEQVL
jgi:hypothetical protein